MKTMKMLFLLVLVAFFFSGCAGSDIASNLVQLPTGEIVSASTERFGAWERTETKRFNVIGKKFEADKAEAEANKAMAEAEKAKATQTTTQIILDTPEKLEVYERTESTRALARANELLGESNRNMAEVSKLLASGGKGENDFILKPHAQPKGVVAESIDSVTGLAKTPSAMITSGGYALGGFIKGVRSGDKIDSGGGDITVKKSDVRVGDGNEGVDISDVGGESNGNTEESGEEATETTVE